MTGVLGGVCDNDAGAPGFTTLVDGERLIRHLDDPRWVILDCRFDLADPLAGARAYEQAHIPGAAYVHLEHDLSATPAAGTGRHPLPDPERVAERLGALGVSDGAQVVAYDDAGGAFAARLWWILRWLGHDAVAVLDGGTEWWRGSGFPVTRERAEPAAAHLSARPGEVWYRIVDARAPERFRGDVEPIDPVAGHIPGALNMPFSANLMTDGRFQASERLREQYRAALGDIPPERVICMCGSGVTACHDLLAMEIAGLGGARLYPGSWSEWITDSRRPVTRGAS